MDSNTVDMVMQWASENGLTATLAALETETGRTFDALRMVHGSELVARLTMYEELQAVSGTDTKLAPGDGQYVRQAKNSAVPTGQSGNMLAVRFSPDGGVPLMATAAADKTVCVVNYNTLEPVASHSAHKAGILGLDFHPLNPSILVSSGMEGALHVFNVHKKEVVQSFSDHLKYVVCARFSPTGHVLATASHDKTVAIYSVDPDDCTVALVQKLEFVGAVQALCWLAPEPKAPNSVLVVAVRDDNYLHYLQIDRTGQLVDREKHNMNMNGDDHVSFAALDVRCAPNGAMVSVATDRSRVIVFEAGTSLQVCNLYGASNDEWSLPRHCWHPSSMYIYCAAQDNAVHVFDIATQKVVHKLTGHTATVRDVDISPDGKLIATASFDKTVRTWGDM